MSSLWQLLLFSFACSIDGIGVGLSYGMRKIVIPKISFLIIFLTTSTVIFLSMFFGSLLANILSPKVAQIIGGSILIVIGCWISLQSLLNLNYDIKEKKSIMKLNIKPLGIVIQILKEPSKADFDCSGIINTSEALILGLALSIDAFSAGFGAAIAGFKYLYLPIFVGVFQLISVIIGLYFANFAFIKNIGNKTMVLPGIILILLGIIRL